MSVKRSSEKAYRPLWRTRGYQLHIRQVPDQTKTSLIRQQQWHVTSALLSGLDEEEKFLRAMSYVIAQGT